MSWKNNYKRLYQAVRKKLGNPTETTFDKRLSRKSESLGFSSLAPALVLLAADKGIGYRPELKKLDLADKNTVSEIIRNIKVSKDVTTDQPISTTKKVVGKSIKKLPQLGTDFADPFMPKSVYENTPTEGYSIMYALENSLRHFISRVLEEAHGENWWSEVAKVKKLEKMTEKISQRKKDEADNWYHSTRGVHEIYYTDYTELIEIIKKVQPICVKYFNKDPERLLPSKLAELAPTRNVIAHNNPITPNDLARLRVHASDWFKYMKHVHSNS